MLDWSCQLLSEAERMVLRRLSVFPAWFDIRDATQICTRLGMSKPAVVEAVASLVTKSIATADVTGEGARYRLPETVRAYSREKLAEAEKMKLEIDYLSGEDAKKMLMRFADYPSAVLQKAKLALGL